MKGLSRAKLLAPALLTTVALAGSLIPSATSAKPSHASPIYLNAYYTFYPTLTDNFNVFDPAGRMDWTTRDIYEPLYIINVPPATNGKVFPWLAKSYAWSNGNKTLTFTIRPGVKWSDGTPFTAQDVAFTFNYGKAHSVADQQGLWGTKLLQSVSASGNSVSFNLSSVDTTIFYKIANQVLIIPQHIWSKVSDPSTFANPTPVGTGPFTQLTDFSTQSFVLAKNPYYWQPLSYDGIKVSALAGNQSANLLTTQGDLDWTGNFIPNCEKVYQAKSAAYHCAYTTVGPVALWFNDLQYPYSLPAFRKAISHAIDRQKIYKIAEYGYETPSDAAGIAGPWPSWADPALAAQAKAMATYDPALAKSMLTAAGFTTKGGKLYDPKGKQVTFTLSVPNGWSDWVLSIQIIQSEMKALGIDVTINLPTASAWTDMTAKDTLPGNGGQLHWTTTLADPYEYYRDFMSTESYYPVGTDATLNGTNNYARYQNAQVSALLKQFRETSDLATQKAAIHKIEAIQLQDMPMIPLVYSASWYTFSTQHFTGWPTVSNMYTAGSPNIQGTTWKVLTTIKPVQ